MTSWTAAMTLGPRWYLPLSSHLCLVNGFEIGFQKGSQKSDAATVGYAGPGLAAETGLALPVGDWGLFEVVARYSTWKLTRKVEGHEATMSWDKSLGSLGVRYRIVL